MPEKSHDMNTKQKDMEKLRPETTFTRNLTSFTGMKTLITMIVLLSLMTLVSMVSGESIRGIAPDKTNDDVTAGNKIATIQSDVDVCMSEPCQNGGTCYHDDDSFICVCTPEYEGILCEIETDGCASDPCQHGGTCVIYEGGFLCSCADEYYGVVCENIYFYLVRDERSKIRFDCDYIDTLPSGSVDSCAAIAAEVTGVDAADYDATVERCELQHCGSNIALSHTNNDNFLLIRADIFPSACVSRTIEVNNKPSGFLAKCIPEEDSGTTHTIASCKQEVCEVDWDVADFHSTRRKCMRKRCDLIEWHYNETGWQSVVTLKITGNFP